MTPNMMKVCKIITIMLLYQGHVGPTHVAEFKLLRCPMRTYDYDAPTYNFKVFCCVVTIFILLET